MRTAESTHYHHIRHATISNPNKDTGNGTMTTTNGVSGTDTHYFELGGQDDQLTAVYIRWFDATSNATINLQTTNYPVGQVAFDSVTAGEWYQESTVITGPTGVAAGSFMLHISGNAARRNRLKVVVAANTQLEILCNGMH